MAFKFDKLAKTAVDIFNLMKFVLAIVSTGHIVNDDLKFDESQRFHQITK